MIPTAMLPHEATIAERTGSTGTGAPAYAQPSPLKGRLTTERRKVRTDEGAIVTADATFLTRPRTAVVGSVLTFGTDSYEVVGTRSPLDLRRPHHTELLLAGPREAAA